MAGLGAVKQRQDDQFVLGSELQGMPSPETKQSLTASEAMTAT